MRITKQFLPLLLLLLLPLLQLSLPHLLLILPAIFILRTVLVFAKLGGAAKDKRLILETIGISHYVEKVRWSLDYLGIPYTEEENCGVLGIFLLGRGVPQLQVPGQGTGLTLSNSSSILRYLHGQHATEPEREAFLRPSAKALELEVRIDQLAVYYRRFMYYNLFNHPQARELCLAGWGLHQPRVPAWQKLMLRLLAPVFQALLTHKLKVNNKDVESGLEQARVILADLDGLLEDGRQFLLDTAKPTYLDIHLSSILGVVMFGRLSQYSGGVLTAKTREALAPLVKCQEVTREAERLHKSRVGSFVTNCFHNYRHKKIE